MSRSVTQAQTNVRATAESTPSGHDLRASLTYLLLSARVGWEGAYIITHANQSRSLAHKNQSESVGVRASPVDQGPTLTLGTPPKPKTSRETKETRPPCSAIDPEAERLSSSCSVAV